MKVVFLGGGSTYIPIIIYELIKNDFILDEIVFVDKINESMHIIGNFCKQIIQSEEVKITFCNDIDKNTLGSDVIISLYRSRGSEGRGIDERLGSDFGILGQESQGIGGFSSALRNIQILSEYVPKIKKYCPNALFLNITNPSGIVTYAANILGLNAIGICDAPYAMKKKIADFFQIDIKQMDIDYFGLNHLGWITDIRVKDVSIIGEIINSECLNELMEHIKQINIPFSINEIQFIRSINAIPSSYLVYYYQTAEVIEYLLRQSESRAKQVEDANKIILNGFKNGNMSKWPEFFIRSRGGYLLGETISSFLKSYFKNEEDKHIICIKNSSYFQEISSDSVIEVSAKINGENIEPVNQEICFHMKELVQKISLYEKLTAEAALEGNFDKAIKALELHPLICKADKKNKLLETIILTYKNELPRFWNVIKE